MHRDVMFILTPPELKKNKAPMQTAPHTNALSPLFSLLSSLFFLVEHHLISNTPIQHASWTTFKSSFISLFFLPSRLVGIVPSPVSFLFLSPSVTFSSLLPLIYR